MLTAPDTNTIKSKSSTIWTSEDQRIAFGRGWGLFEVDGHPKDLELQRFDDAKLFRNDTDALITVLRRSHDHENGTLERKALAVLRQDNPEYFEEVVLYAAQRLGL